MLFIWRKFFEHGDQENIIREELDRLCAAGKLSEEDRRAVREQDLVRFCKTDLLKQLAAAESQGKLWREQPFVIGLPGRWRRMVLTRRKLY